MNLQPMNPPAREPMRVQCAACHKMHDSRAVVADLDSKPGTFYCRECAPTHHRKCAVWNDGEHCDCADYSAGGAA